jgi:hypothetical protein
MQKIEASLLKDFRQIGISMASVLDIFAMNKWQSMPLTPLSFGTAAQGELLQ